MSRFACVMLVTGLLAAVIGFGNFPGIPNQIDFLARVLAATCVLVMIAYFLMNVGPGSRAPRRLPRDQRPHSRDPVAGRKN